jgi:hypothetical protein
MNNNTLSEKKRKINTEEVLKIVRANKKLISDKKCTCKIVKYWKDGLTARESSSDCPIHYPVSEQKECHCHPHPTNPNLMGNCNDFKGHCIHCSPQPLQADERLKKAVEPLKITETLPYANILETVDLLIKRENGFLIEANKLRKTNSEEAANKHKWHNGRKSILIELKSKYLKNK